jgi:hypothetical protein
LAENKIPVLTEVYKPKKSSKDNQVADVPLEITSELVAKVTAQVKPRLETEITDFVLDELRSEIKKAREEIISSTKDFIDKSKADLKTELPNMYQESVKLAEVNLNEKFADLHVDATAKFDASLVDIADFAKQAVQADISTRVNESFEQSMEQFQSKALAENQKVLEDQLAKINQEAQQELTQQLHAFQEKTIAQHESELSDSLNAILVAANESAEQALRDELDAMQEKLKVDHQKQLSESLDGFLQIKGEAAEKDLLKKMQEYQEKLRIDYQEQLSKDMATALEAISQRVEESTQEQTGIMYSQMGTIQQETFAKLREEFNAEKNTIFNMAADEIKTAFAEQMTAQSQEIRTQFLTQVNGDMPEVQTVLQESIETILTNAVPDLEVRLREQLTIDLQQLLLKVKFVLPE